MQAHRNKVAMLLAEMILSSNFPPVDENRNSIEQTNFSSILHRKQSPRDFVRSSLNANLSSRQIPIHVETKTYS